MTAEKFDPAEDGRLEVCEGRPVVLSTHGLTKDFKKLRAVDNLDISVCRGDVFGFLGPNGSGKTTTIRLIFGLIYPTERLRAGARPQGARRPAGRPSPPGWLRRRSHVLRQHDAPAATCACSAR